jgi:hypothetical protein
MNTINDSNHEIVLTLNAECYVRMTAGVPVTDICLCYCSALILEHPLFHSFELAPWSNSNSIFDILTCMRYSFEAALDGKLNLISLPHNIGYVRCERLHSDQKDHLPWHKAISRYLFIDSPRFTSTWLYEHEGKFFIEVTPMYPWEFDEPKADEEYYTYEEFMSSYKSLLTIPLERADIERLYQHTSQLADQILARERSEGERYAADLEAAENQK